MAEKHMRELPGGRDASGAMVYPQPHKGRRRQDPVGEGSPGWLCDGG